MGLKIFFVMMLSTIGEIYSNETYMSPRVYNGEGANIEEFPHTAILHDKCRQFCGGAIISRDIVVTAAHCLMDVYDINYLVVTVGTTECRKLVNKQFVKKYMIHENYEIYARDWNDIALIQLKKPLTFDTRKVQPVNLAKPGFEMAEGTTLTTAGCGFLDNTNGTEIYSTRLMKTNMAVYGCSRIASDSSAFCLRGNGTGGCHGDSGSGFVIDGRLVGIESRAGTVCSKYFVVMATKVSLFTEWIQDTIKKNNAQPAKVSDY